VIVEHLRLGLVNLWLGLVNVTTAPVIVEHFRLGLVNLRLGPVSVTTAPVIVEHLRLGLVNLRLGLVNVTTAPVTVRLDYGDCTVETVTLGEHLCSAVRPVSTALMHNHTYDKLVDCVIYGCLRHCLFVNRITTTRPTITTTTTTSPTTTTTTTTTVLRPLYRTTGVRRRPQLRTGGFCWNSFTVRIPLLTATSAFGSGRGC